MAPLQEFVNNGDYNLSNVSGGPPIAGDPGVLSFGGTIHVFGVSGFGSLMEYVPDNAWGRIWNAYNQTLDASGATIISQPDPVAIGGVMHVYGESANGDLVEYVSDGANGRVWNSYDITQAAHGPTIDAPPRAILINGFVHVYVESSNGDLVEYITDHAFGRLWNAYDQTQYTGGPTIQSSPEIAAIGSVVHVFARSTGGDLEQFADDGVNGRIWNAYDLTQASGGPKVANAVSVVTSGSVFQIFVEDANGNLQEFVNDNIGNKVWNFYDLTTITAGPDVASRPSALYVAGQLHVEVQGFDNDLIDFAPGPSGWKASDVTQASGGVTIGSPATVDFGGVMHVYAAGPRPPDTDCTANNSCTPQTFADTLLVQPGVDAPVTQANEYAIEKWELREGGGAGCPGQAPSQPPWPYSRGPSGNPLNTTQPDTGSGPAWNSVGVQSYQDAAGRTCWYWGVLATAETITGPFGGYGPIIAALQQPAPDDFSQCVRVADAVGNSSWGTPNFSSSC